MLLTIDHNILLLIQAHLRCDFLDTLMPGITLLGNSGILWIIIAIVFLCSKKYRRFGVLMVISLLLSLIIGNLWLKLWVARPRPCHLDTTIQLLIRCPTDFSFPSGHTLSSFASATIICYANKKLGIAAFIVAALIGFSRLYLYVHYPSDVLAGAILGIIISVAVIKLHSLYDRNR